MLPKRTTLKVGAAAALLSSGLPALAAVAPRDLLIALTPRDGAGLAAYARAVSDPASPDYRHFLTPSEVRARFAPDPAALAALEGRLAAAGIVPDEVAADGLFLSAHTTGRPLVGAPLPGVEAVAGLAPAARIRPLGGTLSSGSGSCPAARAVGAATPAQIAPAYGMAALHGRGWFGAHERIALLELAGFSTADISAYESCVSSTAKVSVVTVDGGAGAAPGTFEATADIEDIAGLAPQAQITVYEAPQSDAGDLAALSAIVNGNSAAIVSTSWGDCEADLIANDGLSFVRAENTLLAQAAAQGQTVLAAAGDSGSEACNPVSGTDSLGVDDPAAQPYALAVGGTQWAGSGPSRVESVWNSLQGAGGGGYSEVWAAPSWQSPVTTPAPGAPCGTPSCREVPDVAALAGAPYYAFYCTSGDCAGRGWSAGYGTSFAAPVWAAFAALTAGGCSSRPHRLGDIHAILYSSPSALRDVTSGENDFTGSYSPPRWPAGTGYDLASGLGTPPAPGSPLAAAIC